MTHRLSVVISTEDPVLAPVIEQIAGMTGPEREEMEAMLYMTLARSSWRQADLLRKIETDRQRREERRAARHSRSNS